MPRKGGVRYEDTNLPKTVEEVREARRKRREMLKRRKELLRRLVKEYVDKVGIENAMWLECIPFRRRWEAEENEKPLTIDEIVDRLHKADNYWKTPFIVEKDLEEILKTLYGREVHYDSEKGDYVVYKKKPPEYVEELIEMAKLDTDWEGKPLKRIIKNEK